MVRKLVHYRIRPDTVETVTAALTEFVDAVASNEPDTIYGSLVAKDGVSFVHAMAFPDAAAEEAHRNASYTQRFVEVLHPNCEELPRFTDVRVARSTKKGVGFLGMAG